MKKIILIILFLPFWSYSQVWIGTEIDVRNALFGGTVNPRAYDGVFNLGYRSGYFETAAFFETFKQIEYQSYGVNLNVITRPEKRLVPLAGFQISMINRPWKVTPSLGLNTRLEYHFGKVFIYLRGEGKLRTDWNNKVVTSGYAGIAYKFKRL